MWHEARKQERRIRGLIVDYRKRAERRQYFYDKIQADPTQFLQLHGRRSKIYLDPAVAAAGDGDAIIVPWQGHQDNLIDRFDVRAHLDYIAPVPKNTNEQGEDESELTPEERQLNYERYRILAQNDFLNVSEDKFLHQLYLEEQYGANAQLEAERNLGKKKQKSTGGATIGYSYDDAAELPSMAIGPQPFGSAVPASSCSTIVPPGDKAENSDESDSDIDMDVSIDIGKLDTAQAHELNACGRNYGMKSNDFFSHLTKDADEADALRIAREEEQEKMLLSGRKSRRERRAQKERRIANRPFSPPSYAAKEDQSKNKDKDEDTESRSPSPAEGGGEKITYITSFGGEDEMQPHSKITINLTKPGQTLGESCINASSGAASAASASVSYAQKVKDNLDKLKVMNETAKRSGRRRSHSNSRSPSRRRSRRRSYHRRSRTRSRRRRRYYSRSRSQSRSRSNSWERSRSPSYRRSRKRYSYSSGSSSAGSYTKSRKRRSRSHSHTSRRSRPDSSVKKTATPPATQKTICLSTTTTTTTASTILATVSSVPHKQLQQQLPVKPAGQTVSAVPMISYPLSSRVLSMTSTAPAMIKTTPVVPQVTEPPPPPLKRYYGRKRGNDTSSSSAESSDPSDVEEDEKKQQGKSLRGRDPDDSDELDVDTASERSQPLMSSSSTGNQTGKYSSATETKGSGQASGSGRPNLRERLKRKMQNLLNRQYKADKRAEIEKTERERQLQQEREDEMRELALKLRRRRRELRHKYGTPSSGKLSDSDVDSGDSEAPERTTKTSARRSRSRSGSHSRNKRQRSRSRSRRSTSRVQRKRRSRSPSRSRRQRSRSRSRRSNSRPVERKRRSHSRRRSGSRERRCSRSRRSQSQSRRRRQREHSLERARDRERYRQQHYERTHSAREAQAHGSGSSSGNRGRVVISAPPKLKKLVDY
uniref:CG6695-like protein n=1 Tax=Drosophila buzzatii TaxID=7264 RepID=I3RSF9_DROBU|nr:CG6695-like protein [Drosophila buzzatii]